MKNKIIANKKVFDVQLFSYISNTEILCEILNSTSSEIESYLKGANSVEFINSDGVKQVFDVKMKGFDEYTTEPGVIGVIFE